MKTTAKATTAKAAPKHLIPTPGLPVTYHPQGNKAPHHAMVVKVQESGRVEIIDWTESKLAFKYVSLASLTKGTADNRGPLGDRPEE